MKIVIANDHRGAKLKNIIVKHLEKNNYSVEDIGTNNNISVDYPKYAFELCKKIIEKDADFGILICGTGIGMSIAANKVKGIRCANVHNNLEAKLSKEHNNANVIAISSNLNALKAKKMVDTFLKTSFSNEERHLNRIKLIENYEENHNA